MRNSSKNNEVIDLVESSSDEAEGSKKPSATTKRSLAINDNTNSQSGARKKASRSSHGSTVAVAAAAADVESPIKLFATRQDERERRTHARTHWSWTQCRTFREMLLIGEKCIEWIVISNYLIDFEYLLQEIPELVSIQTCVVFYGNADTGFERWKMARSRGQTLDFVRLVPSDPPHTATNPLSLRSPWGVHHTKMFLVGYADQTCRVVVHSSNLRADNIHDKAQAAYVEDFGKKVEGSSPTSSPFERTLVDYMLSYGYNRRLQWTSYGMDEPMTSLLRRYDFFTAKGMLVPSIPGRHKLYGTPHAYGHWKLRQLVSQHTTAPSSTTAVRPIVCQFSSIGALSKKYLQEQLQVSMDTGLSRIRDRAVNKEPLRLQLVYPTAMEIHNSVEGYMGGASVPGRIKNVKKPFLKSLFHKWKSTNDSDSNATFGKGQNVPHVKTYYQVAEGDNNSMDWLLVTSHNMSKAALGEIQDTSSGRRIVIQHWELGVFLSPQTMGTSQLVPYGHSASVGNEVTRATVPMPYAFHPIAYGASDQPWAVDAM